jgi:HlyD family secretion protein
MRQSLAFGGALAALAASLLPALDASARLRSRAAPDLTTSVGALAPRSVVHVGSQVPGRILRVLADFESPVAPGQILAELDARPFEAALGEAQAAVAAADGVVARAEALAADAARQLERARALAARRILSAADLEGAETSARAASAQVAAARGAADQARAALAQAELRLEETRIRSPIEGVVLARKVEVGQTVAAAWDEPPLFTIAEDLARMELHAPVAEARVGTLRAGMRAALVFAAFPGEPFEGTIRQIRSAPQGERDAVAYDAVIEVANPALLLRPGMTARVAMGGAAAPAGRDDLARP